MIATALSGLMLVTMAAGALLAVRIREDDKRGAVYVNAEAAG